MPLFKIAQCIQLHIYIHHSLKKNGSVCCGIYHTGEYFLVIFVSCRTVQMSGIEIPKVNIDIKRQLHKLSAANNVSV